MQFNFVPNAVAHFFCDGTGIAFYSGYTGDTIVLRSALPNMANLQLFTSLPDFNLIDIQNSFGLQTDEAARVLQYLIDSHLVNEAAGC